MLRNDCDDALARGYGNIVQVLQHPVNLFLLDDEVLAIDAGQHMLVFDAFDMTAGHPDKHLVDFVAVGAFLSLFLGNVDAVNCFVDVVNQSMLHTSGIAFAMTDNVDFVIALITDDGCDFGGSYVEADHDVRQICHFFFFHG